MPCRTVKPGSCCNRNRLGALAEKSERGFPFHPSGGHISPCKASIQNSPASLSQKAHGTSIRCKCSLSLIPLNENKTKQKEKKKPREWCPDHANKYSHDTREAKPCCTVWKVSMHHKWTDKKIGTHHFCGLRRQDCSLPVCNVTSACRERLRALVIEVKCFNYFTQTKLEFSEQYVLLTCESCMDQCFPWGSLPSMKSEPRSELLSFFVEEPRTTSRASMEWLGNVCVGVQGASPLTFGLLLNAVLYTTTLTLTINVDGKISTT